MTTFSGLEIREVPLSSAARQSELSAFLRDNGLQADHLDYALGVYDSDDRLVGCGGLSGDILKCIALSEELRSEGVAAGLISALLSRSMEEGNSNTFVFTKPEYKTAFEALSFKTVGESQKAILLESNPRSLKNYLSLLHTRAEEEGRKGVIVMNANPLTLGHIYLIERAAAEVDHLFIIPVADNPATDFSYSERTMMLENATAPMKNVTVVAGSRYAVSASTFPTYFIKTRTDATDTHIALDLDIFGRHIAPALGATVRFVGSEPTDPLTARYNELMPEILSHYGIETVEIPRLEREGAVISASRVRNMLKTFRVGDALSMVPPATAPFLLGHAAAMALTAELEATPKPGLVDLADNGAHTDMNAVIMRRSIEALKPFFTRLALASASVKMPDVIEISRIGQAAEKDMFAATGGVNTHKGALFSLGLAVCAASHIIARGDAVTAESLQEVIKTLASGFPRPEDTHGAVVRRQFGVDTALDNARRGYPMLWREWLPYLRIYRESDMILTRLLLKIIAGLDDSNVYWRCGADAAMESRSMAADVLRDFSDERVAQLNRDFTARRISPGGSADMLALTLFIDSLLPL